MKIRRNYTSTKNKKKHDKSDKICYPILDIRCVCAGSLNVGLTVPNNVSLST